MRVHFPILLELTDARLITARSRQVLHEEDPQVFRTGFAISDPGLLRNRLKENGLIRFLHGLLFPDDKVFQQIVSLWYYVFRIRKEKDIILTVSNPFSAHLTGLILKKICKHSWIADVGDLYYIKSMGHSKMRFKFEKYILKNADLVVVNSESLKNYYERTLGLPPGQIACIPNGYVTDFSKISMSESSILRLSFIGTSYKGIRDGREEVQMILAGMKKYPDKPFVIQLFGRQSEAMKNLMKLHPGKINIEQCQTDEALLKAYAHTDILLNFSNGNYPGLPSKLEEYVGSGIPILNFYREENEASVEFLKTCSSPVLQVKMDKEADLEISDLFGMRSIERKSAYNQSRESIHTKWKEILEGLTKSN